MAMSVRPVRSCVFVSRLGKRFADINGNPELVSQVLGNGIAEEDGPRRVRKVRRTFPGIGIDIRGGKPLLIDEVLHISRHAQPVATITDGHTSTWWC